MKNTFKLSTILATGLITLALTSPAFAASKTTTSTSATVPVAPAAPAAPSAPTTPATPAPAAVTDQPASDSVKSGALIFSHIHAARKGSSVDLFMKVENDAKGDERIGGAESTLQIGDVVQVTKKDGKEIESPIGLALPAGKTTDVSADNTWIRIKDVKNLSSAAKTFPITFFLRGSPNTKLSAPIGESNGGLLDWLKK